MTITEDEIITYLNSISSDVLNGGTSNRNDYARKILNYPAMMVPSVQEPIIKGLTDTIKGDVSLLDPFMGASNTLVTGMKYGHHVFGQDINPLSVLLSKVKTEYYSMDEMASCLISMRERVKGDSSNKKEISFPNIDKWLKEDVQVELSRLYRAILRESKLKIRRLLWITLAEVIRLTSNDRTSTFKMHSRPEDEIKKRNISPIKVFDATLERSIRDLNHYCSLLKENGFIASTKYTKRCQVTWGDSLRGIRTKKQFNLLVTSPPYGDNQTTVTYGQFSFLPLQWIPVKDIDNKINLDYLRTAQEIDNHSLGGKNLQDFTEKKDRLFQKSITLKTLFDLYKIEEQKNAKKIINFVHDLEKTIDNSLLKLIPGSYMVWTVGNRNVNNRVVRNDKILTDLLMHKGVHLLSELDREILSKRMPGRNSFSKTMSKEKILIFKV